MRASSAPVKILHRIRPLSVTVEIALRLDRSFLIRCNRRISFVRMAAPTRIVC
jgi:hypothetical protein